MQVPVHLAHLYYTPWQSSLLSAASCNAVMTRAERHHIKNSQSPPMFHCKLVSRNLLEPTYSGNNSGALNLSLIPQFFVISAVKTNVEDSPGALG